MHYAICNDFSANQLGFSKNLCIMRIMHYDVMHYEKVYCMMFMNLSQYYNAQTTGYNRVPVACRIMVASSISYNQATILFLQCRTNIIWQRIYN